MKKKKLDIKNDYNRACEFYRNESDRAAAILAASFLDDYLEQFLKEFMINDQKVCNNLLNWPGPLSSFSTRRECAYAFGYINKETRNNIDDIAKIRNKFAHNYEVNSFNKHPISDLCQNLPTATIYKEPRSQFIMTINGIVAELYRKLVASKKIKT